jgi:hypothetical protein
MTRTAIIVGLLAILAGLLLAERSDEARFGPHDKDCVDPASPALNRLPAPRPFFVQIDRLIFCHSGHN